MKAKDQAQCEADTGKTCQYENNTAGFDGFYTYFGANGFSYGSTWKNWRSLSIFARRNSLIFIPSVAPGYDDMRVRADPIVLLIKNYLLLKRVKKFTKYAKFMIEKSVIFNGLD